VSSAPLASCVRRIPTLSAHLMCGCAHWQLRAKRPRPRLNPVSLVSPAVRRRSRIDRISPEHTATQEMAC
jgi:hypothetical protein